LGLINGANRSLAPSAANKIDPPAPGLWFLRLFAEAAPPKFRKMSSVAATQFMPGVATASTPRDYLVVSLHDIAPSNFETSRKIVSELAHNGVRVSSLLVVPNYHHQGSAVQNRQFVSWMRELESQGHEIVIHGYFHDRPRRENETFRQKFMTRSYTSDEGGFYDLDYNEALRRIVAARDEFRASGLTPRGFIAPAWLLSPEGERAARDADLEYTTRLRTLRDLRSGEEFPAWSLVYSVRSDWRRRASLVWNATLKLLVREKPLVRLSIHPPDYSYPVVWRQILDIVEELSEARTPTTYRDWIADQRIAASQAA
jgi:predicted deacetylase